MIKYMWYIFLSSAKMETFMSVKQHMWTKDWLLPYLTVCDVGMYGDNCSRPCGHCLESVKCHHINGTCINGCDSGYQGSHCTEGEHSKIYIHIKLCFLKKSVKVTPVF